MQSVDQSVAPVLAPFPAGCGARFRQKSTLDDAIGSHACSLEALPCV
jgi:hypothetical protein